MKAQYTISKDDYVECFKLASAIRLKTYLFLLVVWLLFAVYSVYSKSMSLLAAVTVGMALVLSMRKFVYPWLIGRSYDSYKSIHEPIWVEIEDQGIRFKNSSSNALLSWDSLVQWRQNENYILVYQSNAIYQMIPKRLQSEEFDIESVVSTLESRLGASK